jgi:hypothetical protein
MNEPGVEVSQVNFESCVLRSEVPVRIGALALWRSGQSTEAGVALS